jgi:phosphatidylethanolamine/phosphatidyl-N-methylethanolamine N-methyltransferase
MQTTFIKRRLSLDLSSIENTYKRYARFYDILFGAVFQPGRKAIINRMNCKSGDRVLEVGVGTGLSLPLYPKDVRITGIDISSDMLALAQVRTVHEQIENVERLSVMDAENMAFDDNSFDKVVAMYVASVVPNPEQLVNEMRRVCKPNGQLVFVNHFHSKNPILKTLESLIAPLSKQLGFRPDFSLEIFLNNTGLTNAAVYPVNIFNFSTMLEVTNSSRQHSVTIEPVGVTAHLNAITFNTEES